MVENKFIDKIKAASPHDGKLEDKMFSMEANNEIYVVKRESKKIKSNLRDLKIDFLELEQDTIKNIKMIIALKGDKELLCVKKINDAWSALIISLTYKQKCSKTINIKIDNYKKFYIIK